MFLLVCCADPRADYNRLLVRVPNLRYQLAIAAPESFFLASLPGTSIVSLSSKIPIVHFRGLVSSLSGFLPQKDDQLRLPFATGLLILEAIGREWTDA